MKKITITLLTALVWVGSCCVAIGQAPVAQADQIADDGSQQIIQDDNSTTGKFEPVTVDPSASSDVALQFPISMANKPVSVEALDGGTLNSNSTMIDGSGGLAFSFQVSDQPGVHRVLVIDPYADEDSPHIVGIVQFEVPSPAE